MLAFFVVATGELDQWISKKQDTPQPGGLVSANPANAVEDGEKNILDFDFWNVKVGRRNFSIRAELVSGNLGDGSRIDELERLRLRDGSIEIPLYESEGLATAGDRDGEDPSTRADAEPERLVLEFERAVYHRSGGLVKGSGEIAGHCAIAASRASRGPSSSAMSSMKTGNRTHSKWPTRNCCGFPTKC